MNLPTVPTVRVLITLQNIGVTALGTLSEGYWYNPDAPAPVPSFDMYLMTVFFKIDGQNVYIDQNFNLQGTATVVGTSGVQGDMPTIGTSDIDPNYAVAIPASIGHFRTILEPIPVIPMPGSYVGGVVGCVVILMQQGDTPDDARAAAHNALISSLQNALNGLIPTLGINKQTPTNADIQALVSQINSAVRNAVSSQLTNPSDWLNDLSTFLGFSNSDSQIGFADHYASASELASSDTSIGDSYQLNSFGPDTTVNIVLNGVITGNLPPTSISLRRLLTSLGTDSVRQGMITTQYQSNPPASVDAWVDTIT